jgi:hypothetical protein
VRIINFIFLKCISREYYYIVQNPAQQQNEGIAKFNTWKLNFLRAILNKTKDRIKNTDIRLDLGLDGIKNYIQKSQLQKSS